MRRAATKAGSRRLGTAAGLQKNKRQGLANGLQQPAAEERAGGGKGRLRLGLLLRARKPGPTKIGACWPDGALGATAALRRVTWLPSAAAVALTRKARSVVLPRVPSQTNEEGSEE